MAERRRGREWSHPPWSPRPRNAHEGPWDGLYPAGYKLVRRAPHARKGLALDRNEAQTNEENWVIRQGPIGVTPIQSWPRYLDWPLFLAFE